MKKTYGGEDSSCFLNNDSVVDDGFVLLMDMDDDIDEAIGDWLSIIWRLVRRYVISNF